MSKTKKIVITVLAVILLLMATCGIAYAIAPREFLQLVLSDSAYTKMMLAKNLTKGYPAAEKMAATLDEKQLGFEAEGYMNTVFDESVFGGEKASQAVSEYASSLKMDASLYLNGALAKASCDIRDNDGSVITVGCIADPMSAYMNVEQLKLGWLNMNIEEDEKQHDVGVVNSTYKNIVDSHTDDDLRNAVYDYAETAVDTFNKENISIASKKEINVGSLLAKGDVVTVVMNRDELVNTIDTTVAKISSDEKTWNAINSCLPDSEKMTYDEFKEALSKLRDSFVNKIDESKVETANLDFFVDKRNNITAVDIDLSSSTTTNTISAILKDTEDRGFSICIKEDNETTLLIDLIKTDEESGTITLTSKTANGPLSIRARYSDLQIDDDSIYGRLVTDEFSLPGESDFGPIKLEITVKQSEDGLNVTVNADIEKFADLDISLHAKKTEYKDFALPKAAEIKPYDKDKFQNAALTYMFKDMPAQHSQFSKVYTAVLTSGINGAVGKLVGALTGDDTLIGTILGGLVDDKSLSEGIGGIISSALNGDPTQVGGIVENFFEAFGLKASE